MKMASIQDLYENFGMIEQWHFVYDRDDVLLDFVDSDGSGPNPAVLAHRYLHSPAVDQVFTQEDAAGSVLWHLTDHLGTRANAN